MNNEEKAINIIREELKGVGVIDGDENMIWKSPDKHYTFKISRTELGNNNLYNNLPRYMVTVEVLNEIGIKMFNMRFNELDAVRILDNIQEFTGGAYTDTGCSFIIPINASNTLMNSYQIYLENIFELEDKTMKAVGYNPTDDYYCDSDIDDRTYTFNDILLKIQQYNPMDERLINRVSIKLSYDEINDFAFTLFFVSIIDIDFPKEYEDVLNRIDTYVALGHSNEMMDLSLKPLNNPPRNDFMNPPIENGINNYNNLMTLKIPESKSWNVKNNVSNQNRLPKGLSLDAHNKGVMS